MFLGYNFDVQHGPFKLFISGLACGPPSTCRPLINIAGGAGNLLGPGELPPMGTKLPVVQITVLQ